VSHIAAALAKSKGKDVPPAASASSSPPDGTKTVPSLRIGPSSKPVLSPAPPKLTPLPIVKPIAPAASLPPTASLPSPSPAPTTTPKSSVLIAVVTVIVVIAAVLGWMLLKKDRTFAAPPTAAAVAASAPASPPNAAAKPSAAEPLFPASLALAEKVRLLPITGAAGGGSQRLSVSGKVYEPGDTVVEGLILQSIEAEEIVFRDGAGNLYTRRL
jgi:hypothetical protein